MMGDPYPDTHSRKQGRDKSKQNGREKKKKKGHTQLRRRAGRHTP